MDAHVQVLPRLRLHFVHHAGSGAACVVQEVLDVPGGLLRVFRARHASGGLLLHDSELVCDPRVLLVAAHLTDARRSGVAVPHRTMGRSGG